MKINWKSKKSRVIALFSAAVVGLWIAVLFFAYEHTVRDCPEIKYALRNDKLIVTNKNDFPQVGETPCQSPAYPTPVEAPSGQENPKVLQASQNNGTPITVLSTEVCKNAVSDSEYYKSGPEQGKRDSENIVGALCGKSGSCQIDGVCGDLVGLECGRTQDDGPYLIVNKTTLEKVASCGWSRHNCKLPPEWTCSRPKSYDH